MRHKQNKSLTDDLNLTEYQLFFKIMSIKIFKIICSWLFLYLGVSLASSIILLKSSLACISLFFFSFLSSSARVFTYWSKTWRHNQKSITERLEKVRRTPKEVEKSERKEPVFFLLDWVEGNVGQTQSYVALCPKLKKQKPTKRTQILL